MCSHFWDLNRSCFVSSSVMRKCFVQQHFKANYMRQTPEWCGDQRRWGQHHAVPQRSRPWPITDPGTTTEDTTRHKLLGPPNEEEGGERDKQRERETEKHAVGTQLELWHNLIGQISQKCTFWHQPSNSLFNLVLFHGSCFSSMENEGRCFEECPSCWFTYSESE